MLASLMVASLENEDDSLRELAEAMVVLAEACAKSEGASQQLLSANVLAPLSGRLALPGNRQICFLALRMLSAIAVHGKKLSDAVCQHASTVKNLLLRTTSSLPCQPSPQSSVMVSVKQE